MFRKHSGRKHSNPLFVIFRMLLSLIMFAVLLGGIYSAYKHFSGLDPLKLDPQQIFSSVLGSKSPKDFIATISSIKIGQKVLGQSVKTAQSPLENLAQPQNKGKVLFSFALIADS